MQSMRLQDWDIMRLDESLVPLPVAPCVPAPAPRLLPAPTPIHPAPAPVPVSALPSVSVAEFYVETPPLYHAPAPTLQYPSAVATSVPQYHTVPAVAGHHAPVLQYPPHSLPAPAVTADHHSVSHSAVYHPAPAPAPALQPHPLPTYQQQAAHPTFATYSPHFAAADPKRHTVRSPVSGKFVRGGPLEPKRQPSAAKERKRPGPKTKVAKEAEPKPPDEPEYAPEVIANAHLTMDEDYYVCSVCKMKFKQPGNARRHIITVHRNEKNHECLKCSARFGRKVTFYVVICARRRGGQPPPPPAPQTHFSYSKHHATAAHSTACYSYTPDCCYGYILKSSSIFIRFLASFEYQLSSFMVEVTMEVSPAPVVSSPRSRCCVSAEPH